MEKIPVPICARRGRSARDFERGRRWRLTIMLILRARMENQLRLAAPRALTCSVGATVMESASELEKGQGGVRVSCRFLG